MFEFLGFGRTKQASSEDPKPKATAEPVGGQAKNNLQREMIRLALSSVLGRHGIAPQWIGCEIMPMTRPGATDAMFVQLVILKWHDGFMRYAPELQTEVFNEIHLFDKTCVAADFVFVWKFAPDCGHTGGKLPDPAFWSSTPKTETAAPDLKVAPSEEALAIAAPAAKFDLPMSSLDFGDTHSGFAATQIDDTH
jgi:hypothetical protein